NTFAFLGNYPGATVLLGWNIKFAAIPHYIAPPDVFIAVVSGQRTNVFANYQAWGKLAAIPGDSSAAQLLGSSGSVYRVEYATTLLDSNSCPSSAWEPLPALRLNSDSVVVSNVFPRGATNRFLRAVLQP